MRLRSLGELRHDQWAISAVLARTLQCQAHRVVMWNIAAQGLKHGFLQGRCTVVVQQLAQHPRDGSQVMALGCGARQQLRHGRNSLGQAARSPVLAGTTLTLHQFLYMGCNLDLHALVVAACMVGQHNGAIEHPQGSLHHNGKQDAGEYLCL